MSSPLNPIDAERLLREIDALRRRVPGLEQANEARARAEAANPDWGALVAPEGASAEETEELLTEFDYLAVARALEEFSEDLGAEIERRKQLALEHSLDIYYAAKDLVEQGHTELIPHVEELERAYRQDYGKEIPPKARRRQ
jgi:exonuclease VII small subunit